jgi:nucleoside-diphosphate-sugar epimerase
MTRKVNKDFVSFLKMKVLVTGATGFLGTNLVKRLTESAENEIVAMVRGSSDTRILKGINIELLQCDLRMTGKIDRKQIGDVDVVIHLAGILNHPRVKRKEYWKVNCEGTRKLAEVFLGSDIKQFIYGSTAAVSGPVQKPVDEEYSCVPFSDYEKSKLGGESELERLHEENSFPITIIRQGLAYGPHDMRTLQLFRAIGKGRFLVIGKGENLVQPTYVNDIIRGIILSMGKRNVIGRKFIITGGESVSMGDFYSCISKSMGASAPKRHIPRTLAMIAAMVSEKTGISMGGAPLNTGVVNSLTRNYIYDISRARTELGYEPGVSMESGVEKTAAWYRENRYI